MRRSQRASRKRKGSSHSSPTNDGRSSVPESTLARRADRDRRCACRSILDVPLLRSADRLCDHSRARPGGDGLKSHRDITDPLTTPSAFPGSGEPCSTTFRRSRRVRHRRFESVHAPRLYVASTSTDALECFRPFRSVRAGGTERNPGVVSGSPLSPRCLHLADGSQPRAHPRKPNGRVVCYEGCRPCQAVLARGLTAST
jgi:hypothetical protein